MKTVIFDMDGTLFQTNKILELSLEDTFNDLRLKNKWNTDTPIERYRQIMGVPLPQVWETLLPNHSGEERDQVNAYFLERLIEHIKSGKGSLYPKAIEVLSYLKDNDFSIFIASNGLTDYLETIVNYYELDNWVIETFSIDEINSLNKSDLVQKILKKYNITNGVVVGDRISDINAAKDNNLVSIGCNFDFAQEDELSQADIIIDDLTELQSILSKLNIELL